MVKVVRKPGQKTLSKKPKTGNGIEVSKRPRNKEKDLGKLDENIILQ